MHFFLLNFACKNLVARCILIIKMPMSFLIVYVPVATASRICFFPASPNLFARHLSPPSPPPPSLLPRPSSKLLPGGLFPVRLTKKYTFKNICELGKSTA
jgi:hypothetical protein